jgi:hypothetical protein
MMQEKEKYKFSLIILFIWMGTMKINENIFISAEIQKDLKSKKLVVGVKFDKNASNVSTESDTIVWYPTGDEIDFIAEVFELIGGVEYPETVIEKTKNTATCTGEIIVNSSQHSSEMRIPSLEDNRAMDVTEDLRSSHINDIENKETIFLKAAEEKKIEEILDHKKLVAKEDHEIESKEKTFVDRILKQKKKKIYLKKG